VSRSILVCPDNLADGAALQFAFILLLNTIFIMLQCGKTPLILASEKGQVDVVKFLVTSKQADVHAKSKVSGRKGVVSSRRGAAQKLPNFIFIASAVEFVTFNRKDGRRLWRQPYKEPCR
jgi:hypothetical protein